MAILITEKNKIIIQGITGKEGSCAAGEMVNYCNTDLVAGIRPGKGGQYVHGIPVYNTVSEAKKDFDIDTSMIYVPAPHVLNAAREALENDIKLIVIITEHVPVKDISIIYQEAKQKGILVVGPSSVGVISPGIAKLGCIGAVKKKVFTQGNIGILSKSGGLCAETALLFTKQGIGQSTVVGIGGDYLSGSSFYELVQLFEQDENTHFIVIIGELGGVYEEQLVELKKQGKVTKPIAAFIAGRFTESLKTGTRFGHTGAIIEGQRGKPSEKIKMLEENGIHVAHNHDQLVDIVKSVIDGKQTINNERTIDTKQTMNNKQTIDTKQTMNNRRTSTTTYSGLKKNGGVIVAGEPLNKLLAEYSFPETIFLLLTGRKPAEKEIKIFEKMLVTIIDHGSETTSSATSRFIISGGNDLNVGVGGGILSIGNFHGGAIENAMKFFYELSGKEKVEQKRIISGKISDKEVIFGFGHKIYKEEDPRVTLLREECQRIGFFSEYFTITDEILGLFREIKRKTIPLNIDGCIAAILCAMNIDYRLGKGIFIIGRTPGLVKQCYDELVSRKKARRTSDKMNLENN